MSINICSMVYKFQKRFWWMLSSLVNQHNAPFLKVSISTHINDPYKDLTKKIKDVFSSKIEIIEREFSEEMYGYRGYVRNHDIQYNDCDWLLFTDADMVFPSDFFSKLQNEMDKSIKENDKRVISIPRKTMDALKGNDLIRSVDYSTIISDPYSKALSLADRWSGGGRISGAGYFQLVKSSHLKELKIDKYANKMHNEKSLFSENMNKFSTDIVFRRKLGGVRKVSNLPVAVHLNHYRKRYDGDLFNPDECR